MRPWTVLLSLAALVPACGLAGVKDGGGDVDVSESSGAATAAPTSGACTGECGATDTTGAHDPGAACGDGVRDAGEACDDGNGVAGDGCEPGCVAGVVAPFEREFAGVMPRAVAVAPAGWIAVAGSRVAPSIAPWLARLSGGGAEVWTVVPTDPDVGISVQALAIDGGGVVHAAGGGTYDDVSGAAWVARFDAGGGAVDSSSFLIGDYARAQGVAIGPAATWYVGGEAGTYSAWVRRLDAAGAEVWAWQQPDGSAFSLAVDSSGNSFAAGIVYGQGGVVWKIDAAGQTLWTRPQPTYWLFLAVDEAGAVYVAGSEDGESQLRLWVAKLGPGGDELWRTEVAAIAGASASDTAGGLVLASTGTLFFATQALWQGSRIFGLDAADGAVKWTDSEPLWRWEDIAVLPSGQPVVVGWDVAGPESTGVVRVYAAP